MNEKLSQQFDKIFEYCFNVFKEKQLDYGPTWLLYRYSSIVDEIWRKVKRIRTLEEQNDNSYIQEGRDIEYVGIINYSIMFLIRLDNIDDIPSIDDAINDLLKIDNLKKQTIFDAYQLMVKQIKDLLYRKNSDYGNAWQSMSLYSMTDQVIIRVYRIKTILSNNGQCAVSEGINAQLQDIINYCIFALIKLNSNLIDLD